MSSAAFAIWTAPALIEVNFVIQIAAEACPGSQFLAENAPAPGPRL
jgi:hypothetical protein